MWLLFTQSQKAILKSFSIFLAISVFIFQSDVAPQCCCSCACCPCKAAGNPGFSPQLPGQLCPRAMCLPTRGLSVSWCEIRSFRPECFHSMTLPGLTGEKLEWGEPVLGTSVSLSCVPFPLVGGSHVPMWTKPYTLGWGYKCGALGGGRLKECGEEGAWPQFPTFPMGHSFT